MSSDTSHSVPPHRDPNEYLRALADRDVATTSRSATVATDRRAFGEDLARRSGRNRQRVFLVLVAGVIALGGVVGWSALRGDSESPASPILAPAAVVTTDTGSGDQAVPAGGRSHTVQAGETLARIAEQYGTSVPALLEMNDLDDADQLFAGQVVIVPDAAAD